MRPLKMTKEIRIKVDKLLQNSALAMIEIDAGRKPVTTSFSISEIAERCGVSAPTIYSWFPGGIRERAALITGESWAKKRSRTRKAALNKARKAA